ncbi:MAG TPA: hypothetical protein VF221_23605 [Chloroflexota bacterium]
MLAELDVMVFLKANEDLERTAERVFGALRSTYAASTMEDTPGVMYYEANGIGFHAALFPNSGDLLDPEFESYSYGLEITSHFWCADMDTLDLEGPLSEYFARMLAFELDVETATEILLETTEDSEIFEIRAYRRNPQYRLDQSPTTPKVFVVETRQVEESFDDEDEDVEEDVADEDET